MRRFIIDLKVAINKSFLLTFVECKSPFDYKANHLTLGKASALIARNIGQALKEMIHK